MNNLIKLLAVLSVGLFTSLASANDQEMEVLQGEVEQVELASFDFSNPPGSKWVSVRCGRRSTCFPPAGYKFRHFNTDIRGGGCKGATKRKVKQTKDFIKTSSQCSVIGRVFVWPAQYCKGNYKYCS